MYAQVSTHPNIAFVVGMLGRYLSNPRSQHWKAAKKVLRYLQGTKDLLVIHVKFWNGQLLTDECKYALGE